VSADPYSNAVGAPVADADGLLLGPLEGVYHSVDTNEPTWLRIAGSERPLIAPVAGAELTADGIRLAWRLEQLESVPPLPPGPIPRPVEDDLLGRFGLVSALTRHEEVATAGAEPVEAGRLRLHKLVDTRPVSVPVAVEVETIEVTHERLRQPVAGTSWEPESIEIPVHRQQASIEKRTVARERVRVQRDVVVERTQVATDVQVERVAVEGDVGADA
jgi:Domain of unknown function (DUF2382)